MSSTRITPRRTSRRAPTRWVVYLLLGVAVVLYLIPVYILLVTSLKSFAEVNLATMWELPSSLNIDSFRSAWSGNPSQGINGLSANFKNSVYLAIPATIISAMLGSINGYILTKWKFRGADVIFILLLFGMFIPYQAVLIPLVRVLQRISDITRPIAGALDNLPLLGDWLAQFVPAYGTIGGLIFVHVIYGIPITTLIFRNYYAAIPTDLIQAAKIDGASLFGIYRYILFPLSVPAFVVVIIWQFTSIWNDFLFGLIVTSRPDNQPITVALNNLAGSFTVEWNVQMAGALISALPTLLVFILLGRYFMRGLLAGSMKG
jgi:glucose/mannose transport system permease protein